MVCYLSAVLPLALTAWGLRACAGVGLRRLIPETKGLALEQMDALFEDFQGGRQKAAPSAGGSGGKSEGGDSLMQMQTAPTTANGEAYEPPVV